MDKWKKSKLLIDTSIPKLLTTFTFGKIWKSISFVVNNNEVFMMNDHFEQIRENNIVMNVSRLSRF